MTDSNAQKADSSVAIDLAATQEKASTTSPPDDFMCTCQTRVNRRAELKRTFQTRHAFYANIWHSVRDHRLKPFLSSLPGLLPPRVINFLDKNYVAVQDVGLGVFYFMLICAFFSFMTRVSGWLFMAGMLWSARWCLKESFR